MIVGINDCSGWGSGPAATIRNAGIRFARFEVGGPEDVANVTAYGFGFGAVIANSDDGTAITTLSDSTQAALALTHAQSVPAAMWLEFMNEPWLKGSEFHAVKYARMYMAALTAIRNAGISIPLLYCNTGSWLCKGKAFGCSTTSGSAIVTVTDATGTDEMNVDQSISGTNIPAGSWVASLNADGTHFTIGNAGSPNATGTGATTVTTTDRWSNPDDASGKQGWIYRPIITVSGLQTAIAANGISLHPYGMPTEDSGGHASGIATASWHKTDLASKWGTAPPIYITEFGYYIDGVTSGATTGANVFDEAEQALRLRQAFVALKAAGMTGVYQYESHDGGWGIMTPANAKRLSFDVVAQFAQNEDRSAIGGNAQAVGKTTNVNSAGNAPSNVSLPLITGIVQVGQTLNASTGVWSNFPTGYSYQWRRCDSSGANCSDIGGAIATNYAIVTTDAGSTFRVVVTATNADGSRAATSAATTATLTQGSPVRIRERPPLRLHASIATPSGHVARWGSDEHAASNVPNDLTFSTTMPGGFEHASCSLPRKPDVAYSDLVPFSTITIYGAGSQIAWQGRLETAPRTSGDHYAVTPGAVGWQAHLEDDQTARMIYQDMDLTHWQGPSTSRRIDASTSALTLCDAQVTTDPAGSPAVMCQITADTTRFSISEMWYDAKGLPLTGLWMGWTRDASINYADTDWGWIGLLANDDRATASQATGQQRAAGPGTVWLPANTTTRTWALVQLYYQVALTGFAGNSYPLYWTCLAVVGNHRLALVDDPPADGTHHGGILSSDIVWHAVSTWAPKLNVSTGSDGTVRTSALTIPHLVFLESTTAGEIVKQATRFELNDWWVDEGTTGEPTFSWMPRDDHGRRWRARVGPSGLSETGLDASKLYNSVVVVFRDVDGSTISVGPTGSGATTIDETLADSDPENPATKAGLKRPGLLNLGIVTTPDRAAKAGRAFLFNQKLLNTSGRAVLTGHVEDDHGLWPAWMVRAGDQISFVDAHSTVNRRIVRSSYNDVQKTCSIDLDSPPDAMDALLQRLGASIESLGL